MIPISIRKARTKVGFIETLDYGFRTESPALRPDRFDVIGGCGRSGGDHVLAEIEKEADAPVVEAWLSALRGFGSCPRSAHTSSLHPSPSGSLTLRVYGRPDRCHPKPMHKYRAFSRSLHAHRIWSEQDASARQQQRHKALCPLKQPDTSWADGGHAETIRCGEVKLEKFRQRGSVQRTSRL